jgi:hypothetical protein
MWVKLDRGNIACSPMPRPRDLSDIVSEFRAVVSLAEPWEMRYDPSILEEIGVKFLHVPTPDFTAPTLLRLYSTAKWVMDNVMKGFRVLIHCYGGVGRSCTVAAAYLILKGMSADEAIWEVRSLKRNAVGSPHQVRNLRLLDDLLNIIDPEALDAIMVFGDRFKYGRGLDHASRVLEYTLELIRDLGRSLGIDETIKKIITVAAIVHDIGAKYDEEKHHIKSYEQIRNSLEILHYFGNDLRELIAWTAYHHRRSTWNPMQNDKIPDWWRATVTRSAAILQLADALDSYPGMAPLSIRTEAGDSLNIYIELRNYDETSFEYLKAKVIEKSRLLASVLGVNAVNVFLI